MRDLPLCDNHAHVNPARGIGPRELARRFKREGGKFIVVVSLLTWSLGLEPGDLRSLEVLYRHTIESVKAIREEGVNAIAIIGLHPAELYELSKRGWDRERIRKFVKEAMGLIRRFVESGEAKGIGEVGRPHWPVSQSEFEFFNELLLEFLELARDLDAAVHIHSERNGLQTAKSIAELAKRANCRPFKVVQHHAEPVTVGFLYENGIIPSIPIGRKGEFEEALRHGKTFTIESDYLDDPKRPGAVIPPWALARRLREYVERDVIDEEFLYKACVDIPRKAYDVEPL